jgi:hypothetical protein
VRRALGPLLGAIFAIASSAGAAEPSRVTVVAPAHPDAVVREATTRLRAELLAAGFTVALIEAAPGAEPRASVEAGAGEARPFATIAIVSTEQGAAADVWVGDHLTGKTLVRRVATGATAEAGLPAALAIRAVELLRASLAEVSAHPAAPADPAVPPDVARWTSAAAAPEPAPPPRLPRALLERLGLELGMAALYGLGDTGGRLAPALRLSYGSASGFAGRLAITGPTATDQAALLEVAYGFDRSFRTLAPVLSLGAGAAHTYIEGSGGPRARRLRTRASSAVLGGSVGIAARAADRAAILLDAHLLCTVPTRGALVDAAPAAGKVQLLVITSLGVLAGF